MGFLDDAVPGGNIAKPLLVALGVLLAGRMFGGSGKQADDASPPATDPAPQRIPADDQTAKGDGGLLDGLGDLLDKIGKQGQKDTADSWVSTEQQNKPIAPGDLGKAIGDTTLRELARRTGMSEGQLLDQLSKVLPGLVDKLTPNGTVPGNQEIARNFPAGSWQT